LLIHNNVKSIHTELTTEHVVSPALAFNCFEEFVAVVLARNMFRGLRNLSTITISEQVVFPIAAQSIIDIYIGPTFLIKVSYKIPCIAINF
jgi:hypothetical protein